MGPYAFMDAVGWALFALWLCSLCFYALSAYLVAAFFGGRRDNTSGGALPPITILKPVRGADDDTYANLESFIDQDYPNFEVIIGVAEADDPAVAVINRLIDLHPHVNVRLVVTGNTGYANLKVGNLAGMSSLASYDILAISDSDMRVGPDYLKALAKGFADPKVGLVTCPYRGAYPGDLGSAFEALTIDTDFLPSVVVAERLEGLSFALGATMAVRREALVAIGGFNALADYLADDYQLGNKVMKAGYKLTLSEYMVDSVERRGSVSGYISHQTRWGRTYRVCRPKGYFLSALTKGGAFSLLYLIATGFSATGWAVFVANLIIRYAQAYYMEARSIRGRGVTKWLWLLPVKDLVGFYIWLSSFTGDTVRWKGESFRVDKEGRMVRCASRRV